MHRRMDTLFAALLCGTAACAGDAPPPPATPVATAPIAVTPPPPPPPQPVPAALPPPTFAAQDRQVLAQMVAVDTSQGHESTLLEPILALYREAGVDAQIIESSPGRGNLVARLVAKSPTRRPLLLLAHVDVVPVVGQPWTVPPFALTEKDGFLWGRGINDDKGMAAAIVALSLELARTHAALARDVIVALTAGEETGGLAGARWLAENHKELIDAEVALNEGGGMLLADDFSKPIAASVGVSEKVFQSFQLVVKGTGGHSSRPPTTSDPVVTLSRALIKVGQYRFPATVLPESKADFAAQVATATPELAGTLRHVIASAPRISPADDAILSRDPGFNAAIRTTCVTTMLKGAPQDNVLPTTAEATVNCRILPGETVASVHAALQKVVGDPAVSVSLGADLGEGPSSPFEGEVVLAVKKVTEAMFPGTPVVPGMSSGASDSRFLRRVGIRAYGVSPGVGTRAEGKAGHSAHGPDERKPAKWLEPGGDYFREIVRALVL